MSNCIELRRSAVYFGGFDLDIPAFMAQVQRVKEMKNAPGYDNEAACNDSVFWWFLGDNISCGNCTVASRKFEGVVVEFGKGRSTHTWRDFYATCRAISKYMKRPKTHNFLVADEYDGFATWGALKVQFGPGMKPFEY